ncbi:MAG TPA: PAS domain S-box protein [Burkholderiaceae bacterium]|nr:PAS domain S-box protein [Burkholderiaceae bacterium]
MKSLTPNDEHAAHHASALLAAIVSSSDDAIISKTLDGVITSWNTSAERLFGYTADEAIGKSVTLIIPVERWDEESEILRRIKSGQRVEHFETIRVNKDGREVHVSLTVSPVHDRQGRVIGASKVSRDISERKRATIETQAAQQLLRLIVDNAPALIAYVDSDYRYLLNNRAYQTWFGDAYGNLTGKLVREVVGAATFEKLKPRMDAALAGQTVSYDDEIPYSSAGTRWINANYIPDVAEDGTVKGFAVLVHDVDERRRAEDAQRFLVALHDATRGLQDPADVMLQIATMVGSHFGVIRCAYGEVQGNGHHLLITRGYTNGVPTVAGLHKLEAFGTGLVDEIKSGRTALITDVLIDDRTREAAALRTYAAMEIRSMICAPIVKAGEMVALLVVADRNPRKWVANDAWLLAQVAERTFFAVEGARASVLLSESRDELERVNAQLSETDRRKDEFLAVLAHELRNPLAPIRNATQFLQLKAPADPTLQNARDIIDRQVKHLVRLVDDLLDVSRISSGKISLQKERVSLTLIVTNAVEASRPLIESEQHQLTVTLPNEPLYLDADLTRMAQVLQNLLNNAAKYTPSGGRIGLHAAFDGRQVAIRITDTGIGIPPEMLSHVFGLFNQVGRSIEWQTGGLGIGLTLVQRLVEMHGGKVEAHSDGLDKGSEFIVRLPAFLHAHESPGTVGDKSAEAVTGLRILVVDDNVDAADTLSEMLRAAGHGVRTEYDGAAAVDAARSHRPDVVLLDIGLPKLNGYDAARQIRSHDPHSPALLVAVTGWGQDDDRRRSKEAGFHHHLVKPVDPIALERILESVASRNGSSIASRLE